MMIGGAFSLKGGIFNTSQNKAKINNMPFYIRFYIFLSASSFTIQLYCILVTGVEKKSKNNVAFRQGE